MENGWHFPDDDKKSENQKAKSSKARCHKL